MNCKGFFLCKLFKFYVFDKGIQGVEDMLFVLFVHLLELDNTL